MTTERSDTSTSVSENNTDQKPLLPGRHPAESRQQRQRESDSSTMAGAARRHSVAGPPLSASEDQGFWGVLKDEGPRSYRPVQNVAAPGRLREGWSKDWAGEPVILEDDEPEPLSWWVWGFSVIIAAGS